MLRATESFVAGDDAIARGELVEDDHPVVKGRELYFEQYEPDVRPKRGRRRRDAGDDTQAGDRPSDAEDTDAAVELEKGDGAA